MKYLVIVGDGMVDKPLKELNGKTPLEVAKKPNMDFLAINGKNGLLRTLVKGLPLGSDIANLSILGYDPRKYYPGGRGPLEAPALNVTLNEGEIAIRFNFITEKNGRIEDYSAGHINTRDAKKLVSELNKNFGSEKIKFYSGKGYRNILVLNSKFFSEKVKSKAPHEIKGKLIKKNLVKPLSLEKNAVATANFLNSLMLKSKEILSQHEINKKRLSEGKLAANMIWFWGAGKKVYLPKFKDLFHLDGVVISGVNLIKGICLSVGLQVIEVPGATSFLDTNYEGKAQYALKALKEKDFVYLHVQAPDEASHDGNLEKKIEAIERIDRRVLGIILPKLLKGKEKFKIAILADHATLVKKREHSLDPVPFAIYSHGKKECDFPSVKSYSEREARKGSFGVKRGNEFMDILLKC